LPPTRAPVFARSCATSRDFEGSWSTRWLC
jgi:hypothetical protein